MIDDSLSLSHRAAPVQAQTLKGDNLGRLEGGWA